LGVQQAAHFPYAPATKALHRSRWRQWRLGVFFILSFSFVISFVSSCLFLLFFDVICSRIDIVFFQRG
uniref:hypothetical protein n=1 Tax=Pseudomonadati TaxID=3379134 RepID=UPI004048C445